MKRIASLFFLGLLSCQGTAQDSIPESNTVEGTNLTAALYDTYAQFREESLQDRRVKHREIEPLVAAYRNKPGFEVNQVGRSIEGRPLYLISMGSGDTDVFLWSQMHGDEPTATQAIFDILKFMDSDGFAEEKQQLLDSLRIHFLPMLNPDGAERFQRRNLLGIDINRDALRLQSPEGQTLKRVRDSLDAEFGFNLHDQSTYYNAERTEKPATISYLAPAYNYEKEIDTVRGRAMKIIVFMNDIIQQYAPGQVGRYNDDFEPRAFGDNIQKWGTSTILIESGGYPADPEKQEIRKLNYVSILSAVYAIATRAYEDISLDRYEEIPHNDRKLFDLKIEGVNYPLKGEDYILDLGIHRGEVDRMDHEDFWYSSRLADQGDLSTYYGYEVLDGSSLTVRPGNVAPEVVANLEAVEELDAISLLRQGYTYVRVADLPKGAKTSPVPLQVLSRGYKLPEFLLEPERNPTFLLYQDGRPRYAVVNGFLVDLQAPETYPFGNALILQ